MCLYEQVHISGKKNGCRRVCNYIFRNRFRKNIYISARLIFDSTLSCGEGYTVDVTSPSVHADGEIYISAEICPFMLKK